MQGTLLFDVRCEDGIRRPTKVVAEIQLPFAHYIPQQERLYIYGFVELKGRYKLVRLEKNGWEPITIPPMAREAIEPYLEKHFVNWAWYPA